MSYNWHANIERARVVALHDRAAGKSYKAHKSHHRKASDYGPVPEDNPGADPLDVETLRAQFRQVTERALEDFRWNVIGFDLLETFK